MKKLMLGNEAIARGAWEAGVTVATAYPGTPSTEITKFIARYDEINAEWSVNEKVALEIAIGASIAGARAIVAMKHVGLNVAMDPLMSVSYPGVNGGLVIVVADDPGQHSSQNEQDTRYFGAAAKVPVLEPSDAQEAKDFVIKAFEISEQFDTPVIVRLTTRISHSQCLVTEGERANIALKEYDDTLGKYIVAPGFARIRRVVAEERLHKLKKFAEETDLNRYEQGDSSIGIVASGIAYQYAKEVFPNASYFKPGLAYPLPKDKMTQFVQSCEKVYVIEEVESIYETTLHSWGLKAEGSELLPRCGELSSDIIRKNLTGKSIENVELKSDPPLPMRPPILCPGCHHRGPFYVLKNLKLKVSGDIGCYTLAAFPPLKSMDTSICMGASLPMAFGFEKARGKDFAKKSVAVIGDSTFWHTGVNGLIDIVYNQGNTTVIILDNSTTAMTGHQDNPSTGKTLKENSVPAISFRKLGEAIGIKSIHEVDAYDLKALEKVISEEVNKEEPSLIITKRPCILLSKQAEKALPYKVLVKECKSCKKCIQLGCPAISFTEDKKAEINPELCVSCGLCAEVCTFNAITSEA